jgi:hypothetical protein
VRNISLVSLPIVVAGLVVVGAVFANRSCSAPTLFQPGSDEEMLEYFADHRDEFEQIRKSQDAEVLGELGQPGARGWYFAIDSGGNVLTSWRRGYLYCEQSLPSQGEDGALGNTFCHIEGNWYIYRFDDP